MKVNAPTSTPLPIRADGSTTALAWMDACATSDLDLGTQDVGAGDLLAVDAGRAAVLGHVADFALDRDLQVEAVAGHHHARELGVRSEEHTSELQSLMRIAYAVFCLKKKT